MPMNTPVSPHMSQQPQPAAFGTAAWHAPKNPAQQEWLSLPGLVSFLAHRLVQGLAGLRHTDPLQVATRAGRAVGMAALTGPATAPMSGPTPDSLEARTLRCRVLLIDANLTAALPATLIAEAVVLVAAIAQRVLGLTPTHAQLEAATAMLNGRLVQLAPGEGKTLAIAMVGVILAWRGRPCHVVTANEYLAERDALLMAPLYAWCGLSTASITTRNEPSGVGALYQRSVVYATANQLLADFLRDDLLLQGASTAAQRLLWKFRQRLSAGAGTVAARPVMPGLCAAIIDEADSVLIDEATTPLIISHAEADRSDFLAAVQAANDCARQLEPQRDYELVSEQAQSVRFTIDGLQRIHGFALRLSAYWQRQGRAQDLFKTVITAREFFKRDQHYIVKDGTVVIIDGHTGRATPGRHWSNGIHQAIEAKEQLDFTTPTKTVARMTFQTFFRHYHVLCGASGTLHGLDFELWFTYGLKVSRVAANTRSRLAITQRRMYRTQAQKFAGLIDLVVELNRLHVPVLVGTRRIQDSENVAAALGQRGLTCNILNAKLDAFESQVIERAGELDSITVATDMAGRGSDIQIQPHIEAMGGLHVVMYESHESARVDWQLYGRAGRQGAQGVAYPLLALDDELLARFLPRSLQWAMRAAFERFGLDVLLSFCLWAAQRRAQQFACAQRRQLRFMQGELRKRLSFVREW